MKKLFASFIALMLSLFMLASCTPTTADPPSSGESTPTPSTSTGEGVVETDSVDPFAEKLEISWFGGAGAPLEDDSWGELKIEELFNVDLKIVRADSTEAEAMLYASGNIPDYIATGSVTSIASKTKQGIITEVPIEELKEYMPFQYELGLSLDPMVFNYSIIDGKNMAIPRFYYTASTRSPVIRADWLKAVDMEVPKTIDELEKVFIAFRNNDPDGDGKKNTYGMTGYANDPEYTGTFATIFGAYGVNPFFWRPTDSGEVEMGFTTEDFVSGLKTLAKWYSMELIDPEFITNEYRTSGEDIVYKFANGMIGLIEGYSFDDYQIDNDGHVSAKWVAANENWKKFFEDNAGDPDTMYQYDVPTDFDDNLIEPYYIAMLPVTGPEGKSGSVKDEVIGARLCLGAQLEDQPEKRERIMRILEAMAANDDIGALYLGPEEHGMWMWTEDKSERVYNPAANQYETYHPQGIKDGTMWFLWPMWFNSAESIRIIGGPNPTFAYISP